jgi:DNA modification methylase
MLELNKIYNQDCLEGLKLLDDDSVDITITSPPYNVGNNNMISYERNKKETKSKYNEYEDNLKIEDYYAFLDKTIEQLIRVTKYHIFFNIQMLSSNKLVFLNILAKYKDNIKEIFIWNKKMCPPQMEEGVLNNKFEFIIVFSKDRPELRKFNRCFFKKGSLANMIEGKNNSNNNMADKHSACFPEYLVKWFITNFSSPGDTILDCFMGSGTTSYVSQQNNRNFIGFEISKEYVDIANKRLCQSNLLTELDRGGFNGSA